MWIAALVLAAGPVLDVPYVAQDKDTCGPAALAMVLGYWKAEVDPAELARELEAAELKGVAGSRLAEAAERRGFRTWTFAGDESHLRRMLAKGRPMIVAWDVGRPVKHDVVVIGYDDHGFLVNDPAVGASRHVDTDTFHARWSKAGAWSLLVLPQ